MNRRRFLKALAAIPAAAAVPPPLRAIAPTLAFGTSIFGTSIVALLEPYQRELNYGLNEAIRSYTVLPGTSKLTVLIVGGAGGGGTGS